MSFHPYPEYWTQGWKYAIALLHGDMVITHWAHDVVATLNQRHWLSSIVLRRWINVIDVDSTSQQRRVPSGYLQFLSLGSFYRETVIVAVAQVVNQGHTHLLSKQFY